MLVSLGREGAYLLCEDRSDYTMAAVQQEAKHTVGAGDSMVAGFLAGYLESGDYQKALRLGIAAGSATACSAGLADGETIRAFYEKCR